MAMCFDSGDKTKMGKECQKDIQKLFNFLLNSFGHGAVCSYDHFLLESLGFSYILNGLLSIFINPSSMTYTLASGK